MNRDETIALWQKCEEARTAALAEGKSDEEAHEDAKFIWNTWAAEQIDGRALLQTENSFKIGKGAYGNNDWIAAETIGLNKNTIEWLNKARVDFNRFNFKNQPNFEKFLFPGQAIFGESKLFTKDRASRPSVIFSNGANFSGAAFFLDAVFDWAQFDRAAGFNAVQFHGVARFDQCIFSGTAWFHHAVFGNDVWMGQAKFRGYTEFFAAQFQKRSSFYGIYSEGAFILNASRFDMVPDFTQANFQGTPRLDNAIIQSGSFLGPVTDDMGEIDRDAAAKFRELRRIAIQGEDHSRELEFHAQEIRTSRWVTDFPLRHPRFWFGVLYEVFSNFGRSIMRPLLALAIVAAIFAAYFLSVSADISARKPDYWALLTFQPQSCIRPSVMAPENLRTGQAQIAASTNATAEAWSLALKNTFVFINWDRADAARRNFGCLYGLTTDGRLTFPYVPGSVSFASLIQIILSSILLFLLLLGVRNLLKLK